VRRVALLLSLLAACLVASSAMADAPPPATTTTTTTTTASEPVVPDGVVLGGIPVGGLTSEQAAAALTARFSRAVVLRIGTTKVTLQVGRYITLYTGTAVAAALDAAPDASLGFRAVVNRTALAAWVKQLARRTDRTAAPARILLAHLRPLVVPAVVGRTIEQGATVQLLAAELAHGTRAPVVAPLKLKQPAAAEGPVSGPIIVIRRGSNLLTLYRGNRYVRQFHVATGQAIYPTPLGRFQIVVKWKDPTWYPPTQDAWAKGLKPVPPGPDNPLGTRWMGLDAPGVGIHGTDEPASIGYSESHGCIRMLVPDAEWLFDHVAVGTPVFIVPA